MNDIIGALETFAVIQQRTEHDSTADFNNVNHHISEEADMFGFSLVKSYREFSSFQAQDSKLNNLQLFKDDDNWNNPGSIELMMHTFGLSDNSWTSGQQKFDNYITIKKEQQPIFADRHVQTANIHMVAKRYKEALRFFVEALKCDSKSVDGMVGRASALLSLGHLVEANKQMGLIPTHESDSKVIALRKRIGDLMYAAGVKENVVNRSSSSSSASQMVNANVVSFVDKLKLSLQSDRNKTTTGQSVENIPHNNLLLHDSSSSSSDESDANDDNEQRSSKSKKRKKESKSERRERRKARKKHKRSRDDSDSDHSRRRKRSKSEKSKKHRHISD